VPAVLQRLHGSAELLHTLKAKFAQDGVSVRLSCCRPSQLLAHRRRCIVAAVASPPLQPAMRSAMRLALADVDERFSGQHLHRLRRRQVLYESECFSGQHLHRLWCRQVLYEFER
jgi:hypothetical protein